MEIYGKKLENQKWEHLKKNPWKNPNWWRTYSKNWKFVEKNPSKNQKRDWVKKIVDQKGDFIKKNFIKNKVTRWIFFQKNLNFIKNWKKK